MDKQTINDLAELELLSYEDIDEAEYKRHENDLENGEWKYLKYKDGGVWFYRKVNVKDLSMEEMAIKLAVRTEKNVRKIKSMVIFLTGVVAVMVAVPLLLILIF